MSKSLVDNDAITVCTELFDFVFSMIDGTHTSSYEDQGFLMNLNNMAIQILKLIMNLTTSHKSQVAHKMNFFTFEEIQCLLKSEPLALLLAQFSELSPAQ